MLGVGLIGLGFIRRVLGYCKFSGNPSFELANMMDAVDEYLSIRGP